MELLDCYFELLSMIEDSKIKEDLKNALIAVKEDKALVEMIESYHRKENEKIRKEVYQNEHYKTYKKLENRLNKMILQSNHILGALKDESNEWKI